MGSQRIGHGQQHAVPLETIEGLLSQYGQQLLCLEADLNEQARGGLVKPSVYRRRMTQLKEVQLKLRVLQRHCSTEVRARSSGHKGELPLINSPTPLEEGICEHFFASSAQFTAALEKEASRVQRWLLDAVSGKPFAFRHVLRLSKLRRMIGLLEKRTHSVQDLGKGLNLQVEKLLHQTGSAQTHSFTKNSVDGLVSLFQAVEKLVTRVAQLKGQIKETQAKATEMDAWIQNAEQLARTAVPPLEAPTPLAITQFVQEFQSADAAIQSARAKRQLAEAFWKEVVASSEKASGSVSLPFEGKPDVGAEVSPEEPILSPIGLDKVDQMGEKPHKYYDLSDHKSAGAEVLSP